MVLPLLGLSGAVAAGSVLLPYRLPFAGAAVLFQVAAHVAAARRGRRSAALWVATGVTVVFVGITLIVGARMGMVL